MRSSTGADGGARTTFEEAKALAGWARGAKRSTVASENIMIPDQGEELVTAVRGEIKKDRWPDLQYGSQRRELYVEENTMQEL